MFFQVEQASQEQSGHCDVCNKHFNSQNQYENHLKSKKHKDMQAKQVCAQCSFNFSKLLDYSNNIIHLKISEQCFLKVEE